MRIFLSQKVVGKKVNAFTLSELLVVLLIIGILVVLILPDQTSVVSQAKAVEAKLQLQHLHSLQRNNFLQYSKYGDNLEQLGFDQQNTIDKGGTANYRISIIQADESGFVAEARAVVDFDQDGDFNTWQIDHNKELKETKKD